MPNTLSRTFLRLSMSLTIDGYMGESNQENKNIRDLYRAINYLKKSTNLEVN
jgi:hypothetical protein